MGLEIKTVYTAKCDQHIEKNVFVNDNLTHLFEVLKSQGWKVEIQTHGYVFYCPECVKKFSYIRDILR